VLSCRCALTYDGGVVVNVTIIGFSDDAAVDGNANVIAQNGGRTAFSTVVLDPATAGQLQRQLLGNSEVELIAAVRSVLAVPAATPAPAATQPVPSLNDFANIVPERRAPPAHNYGDGDIAPAGGGMGFGRSGVPQAGIGGAGGGMMMGPNSAVFRGGGPTGHGIPNNFGLPDRGGPFGSRYSPIGPSGATGVMPQHPHGLGGGGPIHGGVPDADHLRPLRNDDGLPPPRPPQPPGPTPGSGSGGGGFNYGFY
jgi:hypothetical protein